MSDENDQPSKWLPLRKPNPNAAVRVFCFPHAGGAAASFRPWEGLGPRVEVCAVEYPGRWGRLREPLIGDAKELSSAIVDGISSLLQGEFVFVGYSFGTLIAFEAARELRRRGRSLPRQLIVCARHPPSLASVHPDLHAASDAAFLAGVQRRYGPLPAVVQSDPDLRAMVLKVMRADMRALETYRYEEEPPLPLPIAALWGEDDASLSAEDVDAWRAHTHAEFFSQRLPGGHFFATDEPARTLQTIREALDRAAPSETGAHAARP